MNLNKMMKQAQAMQKKLAEAQEKIAEMTAEGTSGGGMVKVTINGKGMVEAIKIDPSIVEADDVEMLEDLTIAAINDARKKLDEATGDAMADATGGMGLPPGMLPF